MFADDEPVVPESNTGIGLLPEYATAPESTSATPKEPVAPPAGVEIIVIGIGLLPEYCTPPESTSDEPVVPDTPATIVTGTGRDVPNARPSEPIIETPSEPVAPPAGVEMIVIGNGLEPE
jgi:hypothetical protein